MDNRKDKLQIDCLSWLTNEHICLLDFEEKGILAQILVLTTMRGGAFPEDPEILRQLCGYHDPDKWQAIFPKIRKAMGTLKKTQPDESIIDIPPSETIRFSADRVAICFGTDAKIQDNIWSLGVRFLVARGVNEGAARGIFGRLTKLYGEKSVQTAITGMTLLKRDIADPKSWLYAAAKREHENLTTEQERKPHTNKGRLVL